MTTLITVIQAAKILGISARTVNRMISEGVLPFVKVGRLTKIKLSDVENFINKNTHVLR